MISMNMDNVLEIYTGVVSVECLLNERGIHTFKTTATKFVEYSAYEKLSAQMQKCEDALKFYADAGNFEINDYGRNYMPQNVIEEWESGKLMGEKAREYFNQKSDSGAK